METRQNPINRALHQPYARLDISETIQHIENGTFISPIPLETFNMIFLNPVYKLKTDPEGTLAAKNIWDATKEERNASLALFTGEIWNMFPEERKPLPAIFKHEFDHTMLSQYTYDMYERAVDVWCIRRNHRLSLPQEQQTPRDMAFKRYDAIIKFGTVHGLTGFDTPSTFIHRGVGTAQRMIWGTLELAKRMAHEELQNNDPQLFTSLAESAYGAIIAPLANMNIEIAVHIMDPLFMTGSLLDARYFRITQQYGQWRLAWDHGELMGIQTEKGLPYVEFEPDTITTRCPAMYAQGETKGIIREYFEWSKKLALHAWYPATIS